MNREQLHQGQREAEKVTRTVYVPREFLGLFRTHDGVLYHRNAKGVIRHAAPRARGKSARRAEKAARRKG